MTAATPASSSCSVRCEPMRLAPPVTRNRLPAISITCLHHLPFYLLPPLAGEQDGLRRCFSAEPSSLRWCFPPCAWIMRDRMSNMQADIVTMRAFSWCLLLSGTRTCRPPPFPCSPLRYLGPLFLL